MERFADWKTRSAIHVHEKGYKNLHACVYMLNRSGDANPINVTPDSSAILSPNPLVLKGL
jgi:hypothetical protein